MKRKGFTLVELLVVIAIIALLISILAPSLNAAKNLARQVMCQTQLKNLGTALVLYSEANKDNMMPGYTMDSGGGYTVKEGENRPPANPAQCLAFSGTDLASDGFIARRQTFGSAYVREIWKPETLLYCPSLAASGTLEWGDAKKYPQPWGTKLPTNMQTTQLIRVTYVYGLHMSWSGATCNWIYGLQLSQMPNNMPTLTDLFFRQSQWGHQMSGVQWFMVFPDTHVGFKASQNAVSLIKGGLDPYSNGNDYNKVYDEIF